MDNHVCKQCGKEYHTCNMYGCSKCDELEKDPQTLGYCSNECFVVSEEYNDKMLLFDYFCLRLEPQEREILANILADPNEMVWRYQMHLKAWIEMDKNDGDKK